MSLSGEVFVKLVKYEGYEGKNFRELEGILRSAIINAHNRDRKEVLVEDLPPEVRSPQMREVKKVPESDIYNAKDIPLKDILNYANGIRASIIKRKIEGIYQNGKEIKPVLHSEGISTEGQYTNIRNKIERILGGGSLKKIREQFKRTV
jgi:hypothetical protein